MDNEKITVINVRVITVAMLAVEHYLIAVRTVSHGKIEVF
jgi:hypothetical protein